VERRRQRLRLRLLPYVLLLTLPLGAGVWAFSRYAASNARERADTRLQSRLAVASHEYADALDRAGVEAHVLAASRRVQRALASHNRRVLGRVANARNVVFTGRRSLRVGRVPVGAPRRSVEVVAGRRMLGSVTVAVPLDRDLRARLAHDAGLGPRDRLVADPEARLVRGKGVVRIRLGGESYRAVGTGGGKSKQTVRLVLLSPESPVVAAEARATRRVLFAGLSILGGVVLIAYGLTPAIARSRFVQQQRAQATQVLSHIGDGVFLLDGTGRIALWNPGAEAITGFPAREALGRRPEQVFAGWSVHRPALGTAPPGGPPAGASAETARYEIGGRELWLSFSGVEFPEGTVYAFRDLSEQHRLEEARSDFVATVSHELRTPLASIHGAAATLHGREMQLEERTRRQLLEVIYDQSDRLSHLVEQILLANQLSSGSVHVEARPFDARELADSVVDGVRPMAPPAIDFDVSAAEALPPVEADPERTRQVLRNLIENAVKYSPGGGRVAVELSASDGHVCFTVSDEGLGIPAQEQERIFQKFYRLDPSMTRGIGGSGLGLFICRELVELMGGRLRVRSDVGVGSTFSFYLPIAAGAAR
jgi:PAS domain S-box-containing protein